VFGAGLTMVPRPTAQPLLAVLEAIGATVMKIIRGVLQLAPYGVFALIFAVTARFGWGLLGELGYYMLIVLVGLFLHSAVVLSGIVSILGGMSPVRFWSRVRAVIVTGFSTSSSSATLPTSMAVAQNELGISPKIAGFVLPLGATMNMNGTALYEGVTVLFLAEVFGISLDLSQQVLVLLLAVITAIGAAGVPGGSLPLLMGVLATVGAPPEGLALILGVDRLLDMARTVTNVTGDLATAVVIQRLQGTAVEPETGVAPS
jgi:DAACS family dicarboxylate/amino acid:cation (Na+ or H+) symporter